jgi:hypothetical protein
MHTKMHPGTTARESIVMALISHAAIRVSDGVSKPARVHNVSNFIQEILLHAKIFHVLTSMKKYPHLVIRPLYFHSNKQN